MAQARIAHFILFSLFMQSVLVAQAHRGGIEILGAIKDAAGTVVPAAEAGKRLAGGASDGDGAFHLMIPVVDASRIGGGFGYLLPGTFLKKTTMGKAFAYPFLFYKTNF
jgi:hypothetical protein